MGLGASLTPSAPRVVSNKEQIECPAHIRTLIPVPSNPVTLIIMNYSLFSHTFISSCTFTNSATYFVRVGRGASLTLSLPRVVKKEQKIEFPASRSHTVILSHCMHIDIILNYTLFPIYVFLHLQSINSSIFKQSEFFNRFHM